ncbi:MAG TPA: hypothetical protein VFN57_00125, partial [Thermomicrobiaceae bacterium]|nr:hypothetical protein [Thermomicrobiaceae bacterium]
TNDVVTLAIAADRAPSARTPQRWRTRPLIGSALRLALPLLLLSSGVFWAGRGWLGLGLAATQTLVFVWLVAGGQATLYLVRTDAAPWRTRPGSWVLGATVADLVVVGVLATRGWLMAPVPPVLVVGLLGLALLFFLGVGMLQWSAERRGRHSDRAHHVAA